MKALGSLSIVFLLGAATCQPADPGSSAPPETMPVSGLPPSTVLRVIAPQEPRKTPPTTTTVAVAPPPVPALPAPQWANWSHWRITAEGVPYYSGRPACNYQQASVIAGQFANRGASVSTQQWAIYVASREGGCNYLAVRVNAASGDDSHCTFQLNARSGGPLSPAGVLGKLGWTRTSVKASLENCAAAAAALWAQCGKGPWIQGDYGCRRPTS